MQLYAEGISVAGVDHLFSSEFLPNGTSTWQNGPELPAGAEFMVGGHGVAISETELVLMGGLVQIETWKEEETKRIAFNGYTSKQIWKFNTITEEWHLIGNLKIARFHHKAVYLNGKVIVSGGMTQVPHQPGITVLVVTNSTEIFDPHLNDVKSILVGNLNVPRNRHGMGTILKNGIRKVIVFGGVGGLTKRRCLNSIEEWDPEKNEWTLLKQKLSESRYI